MSLVSRSFCSGEHGDDDSAESGQRNKYQVALESYMKWLDNELLKARCVTAVIVGACGALLGAHQAASIDFMEALLPGHCPTICKFVAFPTHYTKRLSLTARIAPNSTRSHHDFYSYLYSTSSSSRVAGLE